MRNLKLVAICGLLAICATRISAQTTTKGFLKYEGDVNFMELAKYEKEHPVANLPKYERDEAESEDFNPYKPEPDPSLVFRHSANKSTGTVELPVSPSPSDTFQSTITDGSIPPDTHGAVGSGNFLVTADNSYISIQNRTGGSVVGTVSLNGWWAASDCYDPRVHYDPYKNVWIMVTDYGGPSSSAVESIIYVAVSTTSDPTGTWHKYSVVYDATLVHWLDFPSVGFNNKWVVITGNGFTMSSPYMGAGATAYIINYAAMISGPGGSLPTVDYTRVDQGSSFSICMAQTYSATEPNIFGAEVYHESSGQLKLWKISGPVGSPTMSVFAYPLASQPWQSTSYAQNSFSSGTPPGTDFAPQSGTTNKVQTNDDRINNLLYHNGYIWFSHEVFLNNTSISVNPTRSSIMWWQVDTSGPVIQNGLIDDPTNTNFYAFPSIAVNANNDALIGFACMSATTHPSAAYALHMHTDPVDSMRPKFVYRHGQSTYYNTNGGAKDRWGDYSATVVDPANNLDFWTNQESVKATNAWDTWWAKVTLPRTIGPITGPDSLCANTTDTLADTSAGGTWSCSNSRATISATGAVTGVSSGLDTISYTVTGSSPVTYTIFVKPAPHPVITMGGHTLSVPAVYLSYQWEFGGVNIAGATTNTHVFAATGNYQVKVDSANGCYSTSTSHNFSLGVNEFGYSDFSFGITQSGNTAIIYASSPVTENIDINVFDESGRLVVHEIWTSGSSSRKLDNSWFANGLYLVRLTNSTTSVLLKWVKE